MKTRDPERDALLADLWLCLLCQFANAETAERRAFSARVVAQLNALEKDGLVRYRWSPGEPEPRVFPTRYTDRYAAAERAGNYRAMGQLRRQARAHRLRSRPITSIAIKELGEEGDAEP